MLVAARVGNCPSSEQTSTQQGTNTKLLAQGGNGNWAIVILRCLGLENYNNHPEVRVINPLSNDRFTAATATMARQNLFRLPMLRRQLARGRCAIDLSGTCIWTT